MRIANEDRGCAASVPFPFSMNKQPTQKFKDYTKTYFNGPEKPDLEKRNELILTYTPLIKYIATRLASRLPSHVSTEDLISCGIIGLIDAIEKFDLSKNVQFKTYAEFRIKGAMLDELRSLDWVPRSVRRKVTELENALPSSKRNWAGHPVMKRWRKIWESILTAITV